MITLYHIPVPQSDAQPTRRPTGEGFWIWREMRRHEYMAAKWREIGNDSYADLCDRWAEQARLEVLALARVDEHIAALDATLKGGAA